MNETTESTRRSFLNWVLGFGFAGWLSSILFPIVEYLRIPPSAESTPTSVVAAKASELKPNQGVVFRFGNQPAIVVRATDGSLKAFSAVCTHLQCTVQYRNDLERIWCACHNGVYDLNGQNIAGPPPRPLEKYNVMLKGDDVIVSKA
jgi:Rieske Fe-S protein